MVKKQELSLDELLKQALVKDEEKPYEIPGNWVWTKLGEITTVVGGGTPASNVEEYYIDGDVPWITPADLSGHDDIYISCGRRNITSLGLDKSSARLLPKNTVLLSSRAPIGYVAIASNELCTNQGFKSFLPSRIYIPKFLYFYLLQNKDLLESYSSGTTFLELSAKKAFQIPIPIPPVTEQHRIVNLIESLIQNLDHAKELIENALYSFENRKSAILHKAFTGELTAKWRQENGIDIEKDWKDKYLSELSILITKGASPKWQGINYVEDESQVLFITSENVREGFLDLASTKYLENKVNNKQKRSVLKKDDVLINIVGASIGRAAIYDLEKVANINQAVCLIRLNDVSINKYLCYFLNSPVAQKYYAENKVDVARANLSLQDINNICLPVPSHAEQIEIVRILDELLYKEQKAKELYDVIENIEHIKKSILARAFRGDLSTNNPEEESALELLKEVLREKVAVAEQ